MEQRKKSAYPVLANVKKLGSEGMYNSKGGIAVPIPPIPPTAPPSTSPDGTGVGYLKAFSGLTGEAGP